MKIAVYAIYKNEPHELEGFLHSACDADYVLICDTGGDTGGAAKNALHVPGVHIQNICVNPWRFDKARDAALALLPSDIDVCIALDMDERLEPGWREEIERIWVLGETTRMRYLFDWGSGIQFKAEKIHTRNGYRWHHPVHEQLRPDLRVPEVWAETDKLLITHHPDPTKSRGQYLDLLKLSVQEDPNCPHNAFYYARELYFYARHEDAIVEAKRYLNLPGATWNHERAFAWRVIAKSHAALEQDDQARPAFLTAIKAAPHLREARVEYSQYLHDKKDWPLCLSQALAALSITDKQLDYTMDPSAWGAWPFDLASIAAFNLGNYSTAFEFVNKALDLDPTNERIAANYIKMRDAATAPTLEPTPAKQTREIWVNIYKDGA